VKRILRYFRAHRLDIDQGDETQAHFDERIDEYTDAGVIPAAARKQDLSRLRRSDGSCGVVAGTMGFRLFGEITQDLRMA
jgi:hypothetical protein